MKASTFHWIQLSALALVQNANASGKMPTFCHHLIHLVKHDRFRKKFWDENIIGNETIFFIIDSWDDICSFRSSISSLWTFLLYSNSSLSVSIFLSKSTLTIVASSTSRIFVKKDRFWSKMVDFWQKRSTKPRNWG